MVKKQSNEKKVTNVEETNIDKELLVSDIKKEVLNSLDEEITKRVEFETKNKLEKMEKRIYKYKNAKIVRKNIFIILLLALIVFETKILYDNDLLLNKKKTVDENIVDKENNTDKEITKNEDNDNKEEVKKDLKWYIDNYSYLLDNIKTNLTDSYYLYKDNYSEDTIDIMVRLNMAYQLLSKDKINISNSVITINENDIKDAYKKIFGSLDKYSSKNFNDDCIQFIYNENSKAYLAIDTECQNKVTEKVEKIENIYEEDNNIVIETIVGVYDKENNSLTNINGDIVSDNFSNNIDEYKESLDSYKYTFIKKDENYYLEKIEKIIEE